MNEQKLIIKQLERQFDDAFKSLLNKLYQLEDVCDNFRCYYGKESKDKTNEKKNQEATNESNDDDDDDVEQSDSSEDEEEEEESENKEDDHSTIKTIKDSEQSDSSRDEENSFSSEQSSKSTINNNNKTFIEFVEPELIRMAVSQAKLMTKAFLSNELNYEYEQRILKLEKENFHLRQEVRQKLESLNYNDDDGGDNDGYSTIQGNNDIIIKGTRKHTKKVSKHVTNLKKLEDALNQEINYQAWLTQEKYLKKLSMLNISYQNKICGLNLVISYLKKELAGRVQQLQLLNIDAFDKVADGNSISSTTIEYCEDCNDEPPSTMIRNEQFIKIWNQIVYEILLNRFKTLIRVAEISEQNDKSLSSNYSETTSDTEQFFQNTHLLKNHIESILSSGQCRPIKTRNNCESKINFERMGQIRFITIFLDENQPLGLEICGGNDDQTPIFIWKITENSLAAKNGRFCVGDMILSIQSQVLIGNKSKQDALAMIQNAAKINGSCRLGILRIPLKNFLDEKFDFELLHDDNFIIN